MLRDDRGLLIWGLPVLAGLIQTAAVGMAGTTKKTGEPSSAPSDTGAVDPLHAPYDRLLHRFVHNGRVDYAGLKGDPADLESYLAALAGTDPSRLPGKARLALWINAYNAFTLKLILNRYPGIESIKDIPNRWDRREWVVGGKKYSLSQIEHEILRKQFREPRIHFAIVCASISCPPLASEAYQADRLDAQLTRAARTFLADPKHGFRARREEGLIYGYNNNVYMSKIFKWFGGDFEKQGGSVVDAILPYLPASEKAFVQKHHAELSIHYMSYDWRLNAQSPRN